MIAIAREHLMPDASFALIQRALADSSDHSVQVEREHYAIKPGDAPRLSNLEIWRLRFVLKQWWRVLGLHGEPLRPLRDRQQLDEEDLTARVSRTIDAALSSALPAALETALERATPAFLPILLKQLQKLGAHGPLSQ